MLLQRDKSLNFVEIILDLRRSPHRLTIQQIANAINVDVNTLKGWFYHAHTPGYEDGKALVQFHDRLFKSCKSNELTPRTVIQSPSRAHVASQSISSTKETTMAKKPKQTRTPGEQAPAGTGAQAGDQSDVDAAIAAGQSGKARKIAKPRAAVPASKVKGDPLRAPEAAVNAKKEMPYAEAMVLLEAGKLTRSVLTEKGWVAAPNRVPPAGARI